MFKFLFRKPSVLLVFAFSAPEPKAQVHFGLAKISVPSMLHFDEKIKFNEFVQNNFYGTQHLSGKFSKNILHFCQVIKKLSLIIYTLLEWATDYTYTSITYEFNTFY